MQKKNKNAPSERFFPNCETYSSGRTEGKQSAGCLHKFTPNRLITATIFSKLMYRTAALFWQQVTPHSIMANIIAPRCVFASFLRLAKLQKLPWQTK